jgi:hypothetical protein
MALWGNSDSIYSDGTINVNLGNNTITGSGVTFNTAGISAGDVITVGSGASVGQAVITEVTSATVLAIADTANFVTGFTTFSGESYFVSGEPIYPLYDSNALYQAPEAKTSGFSTSPVTTGVYGVDATEVGLAATTAYAVAHGGWVGVTTYIDCHGELRVKQEVLVATGTIASDAADDSVFRDV